MAKIIAIDDDEKILRLITKTLPMYDVQTFSRIEQIDKNQLNQYDLMLLDVMMPEVDGFEYCETIREIFHHPIIFLTAKSDEYSLVKGLNLGADDYIMKPFGVSELRARVGAHLRSEQRKVSNRSHFFIDGNIIIDYDLAKVLVNHQEINLTKTQYLICKILAGNKGKVMSKEQIFDQVFPFDSDTQYSTVTEHVRAIRKKFCNVGENPINTVWGIGYVW